MRLRWARVMALAGALLAPAQLIPFSLHSCLAARAAYAQAEGPISAAYHAPFLHRGASAKDVTLAFSEENLPPAQLSVTASATPGQTPGAPTASETPAASASATLSPSPEATPTQNPYEGSASNSPIAASPSASPTEIPPALDVNSLAPPEPPLSDQPLTDLIEHALTPARAASLRIDDQARKAILHGHYDEAIRRLGRAVSVDPSDSYTYFFLGRAYLAKRHLSQALTFLQRAEIGFGHNPPWLAETLSFEGAAYEEQGHYSQAADAYRRALIISPGLLMARVGWGRVGSSYQSATGSGPPGIQSGAGQQSPEIPPPPAAEPPPSPSTAEPTPPVAQSP